MSAGRPTGAFVAVVGPSGAGKDTLIRLAKDELQADCRFVFVRRLVTRSADPDLEDHDTISAEDFEAGLRAGFFSLHWQAHGLSYALPSSVDLAVSEGLVVVANLSRHVLEDAARRYYRLLVVNVDAPHDIRRARIAARGRETGAESAARVSRRVELPPGLRVATIVNDGCPEDAAARLVALLKAELSEAPAG